MAGFLLFSFDYQQAQVSGFVYEMAALWLLCMVSLTIVATLKAVGIILHFSAHCAWRHCGTLTQRFHIALLLATGISVIVSMTGVWLSFYRQRTSSDDCRLIRGFVHHDVCRYQHQRTQKGNSPHRICYHPISTTSGGQQHPILFPGFQQRGFFLRCIYSSPFSPTINQQPDQQTRHHRHSKIHQACHIPSSRGSKPPHHGIFISLAMPEHFNPAIFCLGMFTRNEERTTGYRP